MKISCSIHGTYDSTRECGCPRCVEQTRHVLAAAEELLASARASRRREHGAASRFQEACERMQATINSLRGRE